MTRKLKILMLCGQGQNAAVFRGKTEPIRRDIDKNVEFVFVDPPYLSIRPTLSSADYSQPQLDSVLDDNGTTVQKRPENIPRLWSFSGDLNAKDYRDIFGKDWDVVDCLKLVRRVMEEEGPFDACVGFSTGSTLAAIVMALLQNPKLHPVFDAPGPNWPPKQFEFAILAAGFYPSDKKIQMWFDDKIRTPTLMVLGTGDTVVGDVHSIPLTRCFANPRIEWHSGGHFIPTKPSWRAFFKAYVEQYLTDDTPRPELLCSGCLRPLDARQGGMSYRPPGAAGGAPSLAFAPKNEYSPLEPAVLPFPPPPPPPPSSSASMQAQPQQQQHPSSQPQPAGSGKKRSRQSTSGPSNPTNGQGHGVSPDGGAEDGEDEESKARKRRLALSCIECKRRKIKCDRKMPCTSCIRRKVPHSCSWDDDPDSSGSFALNSDVRHIARRLAHLESLFAQTNPGLLPNPSSTNPSAHQSPSHSYHSPNRPSEDLDGEDPQSHSDTEDAAVNLEDVAFAARVPVLQAISTAGQGNKRRDLRGGNGAGGAELTSALTSILAPPLDFDQDGRPRSAVRLGLDLAISANDLPLARSASMAQIFAVLPGKEISDFLIQKYFSEMDWDYSPLDANAFIPEHERYREMLLQNREDSVDPLWVGVFCMVLALSLEGFWSRPSGAKDLSLFRGLTERELQDLPSVWHDAALRALQIGEWGGAPRIRTIQCIILLGQYIQISSSSGQHGRFLNWAASGIRVAQRLGLHRLGSNSETMPPDDPALPPGKNSLKRETAVRLFNILVVIDSLLSDSSSFRCYLLHPSQYNTALPSNLNYSELSRTEWRTPTPAPSSVLTDASFEIAQCKYAAQVRRALDHLVLGEAPFSYTRVLDQDREFRKVLEELPDLFSERCPPLDSVKLRYQRAVLHESVYTRIVRLHRPFLSRGYNPTSQFRYSTEQCVRSAKLIIASNYELLRITSSLWWMYTATLGSAIVIFMDLFHTIDTDMSESAIKEKKDVLLKASILFNTEVASPALRAVVEQGRRILSGLFAAEDKRRTTRVAHAMAGGGASGPEVESFAHILQRISQEVSLQEQRVASAATAAEYSSSASSANRNGTPYVPETAAPTPYGQMAPPQNLGNFEYWPEGLQPPPQQDFTAFFDTLASEDWTAAFNSGSESGETSGLLGQMQATW